jgi:hypothetical protein
VLAGVVDDGGAAGRPSDQVHRTSDADRIDQRVRVVSPIAKAARGVDGDLLSVAEPAHVRRDQPIPCGRTRHEVLEEPPRGQVAVDQHDWHAVRRTRLDVPHAES